MGKAVSTTHNSFKIFGIKVWEFKTDYVWLETEEDTEALRDDIILHERLMQNKNSKKK